MKIKLFLILFAVTLFANTQNYILNTSGLLDQRAVVKINQMANEVKQKIGVNIYLDIKGDNGIKLELPMLEKIKQMKQIEKNLVKDLEKPYVLLTLAIDQHYSNILYEGIPKDSIDKDDILDGYVIPLLAAKDKNLLKSKVSAAAFNGFAQIADSLAETKNIKLETSIGSEGKTAGTIWKIFMYTIVLFGIIAYVVIIMREKKYKGQK